MVEEKIRKNPEISISSAVQCLKVLKDLDTLHNTQGGSGLQEPEFSSNNSQFMSIYLITGQ